MGLVVDAAWLERKGYSGALRRQYVAAGWLEQPARRVYRRPEGALTWEGVVVSLQNLLELPLIVGGMTALQMQGLTHYLTPQIRIVHLHGIVSLPTWLEQLPLTVRFQHHNDAALFTEEAAVRGLASLAWDPERNQGRSADPLHGLHHIKWEPWDWPLTLSTPERAYLELLHELPNHESFEHADKIMEGLPALSPRRLAKLLRACRSVKVKRLFFFFADRHQHSWRKYLNPSDFDLGSGKRSLVKGGRLDATYQITVPEALHGLQ